MYFAIALQFAFALLVVMVAAFFGSTAFYSALAGTVVVLVPNLIFALYLKMMGKPSLIRFFIGEMAKIAVVVLISVVVWRDYGSQVNALAYWAALIIVVKAHAFGLLRTAS
jgi:F0F1-type ATP synthase assembly protein I